MNPFDFTLIIECEDGTQKIISFEITKGGFTGTKIAATISGMNHVSGARIERAGFPATQDESGVTYKDTDDTVTVVSPSTDTSTNDTSTNDTPAAAVETAPAVEVAPAAEPTLTEAQAVAQTDATPEPTAAAETAPEATDTQSSDAAAPAADASVQAQEGVLHHIIDEATQALHDLGGNGQVGV